MPSNLFENLMQYGSAAINSKSKKRINESTKRQPRGRQNRMVEEDETLLNLGISIPSDKTDLTPDDIDVTVGVMDVELDDYDDSIDDVPEDADKDTEPADTDDYDDSIDDEPEDDEKKENLRRRFESFNDDLDADYGDEAEEELPPEPEDVPEPPVEPQKDAKTQLTELYATMDDLGLEESIEAMDRILNGDMGWVVDLTIYVTLDSLKKYCKTVINALSNRPETLSIKKESCKGKNCDKENCKNGKCEKEEECDNPKLEGKDCDDDEECKDGKCKGKKTGKTLKERRQAQIKKEGIQRNRKSSQNPYKENKRPSSRRTTKKESLLHLDDNSLNKLFTRFVKDNYKNIDKVVISKAVLENNKRRGEGLYLEGKIYKTNGQTEKIALRNVGFSQKLEGKRFIMDFSDVARTFGVVTEGKNFRKPFRVEASLKEGILTFNKLKYGYKTKMNESVKVVKGGCMIKG